MGFGNKTDTSAPWGSMMKFKIYPRHICCLEADELDSSLNYSVHSSFASLAVLSFSHCRRFTVVDSDSKFPFLLRSLSNSVRDTLCSDGGLCSCLVVLEESVQPSLVLLNISGGSGDRREL